MWQWLIRGWLAGAAKQELYARAEEMLRDQLQRQQTDAPAAEGTLPPPCDVGLVFPTVAEAAGVVDHMADPLLVQGDGFEVRLGQFAERHVAVVHAGAGADNAAKATEALVIGHRPCIVVAAGFADALSANVARGDIVLASHIVRDLAAAQPPGTHGNEMQSTEIVELPTALAEMAGALATRPGVHIGRIATLAEKLTGKEHREMLGLRLKVLAADWSAGAVGHVCRRHRIPFFAVHAISRGLADETSREIRHLKRQKSLAGKLGAVLGAVTRRPSSVKEMWQSTEDAIVAGDRLAKVLGELVGLLPGRGS